MTSPLSGIAPPPGRWGGGVSETVKFDQVNLVVTDMAASVAFYRRLGVDIADTDPNWQSHHRSASTEDGLDLDFDSTEFAKQWDAGWSGARAVLGFRVESRARVDETYVDLVSAGYQGQQPPYDASWGARYAVVEDPDGNPVGIMSPPEVDRRTPTNPPPRNPG